MAILTTPSIQDHSVAKNVDYKNHGFKFSFNQIVRTTDINVIIVIEKFGGMFGLRFGVYVKHGAFGGAFWKSEPPLIECDSLEKARNAATTIYGITGSGDFATVINATKFDL